MEIKNGGLSTEGDKKKFFMQNKNILILILSLFILMGLVLGFYFFKKGSISFGENGGDNYQGSLFKNNYVWGGAMNLAWNDLNENVLHEKLKIKSSDPIALSSAEKFNNTSFSKKDLDEASYYIKSGYGPETVMKINQESRQKFTNKSFGDLSTNLGPKDIIAFAYFLKQVEYPTAFTKGKVSFSGVDVKGFFAGGRTQKDNVQIIQYENDDKFIISLKLKDENDELILAKGFDMNGPKEVVNKINSILLFSPKSIGENDLFEGPKLHLDHSRDYTELINKELNNQNFTNYFITGMSENIKFDMDEKGARVENRGGISVAAAIDPEPIKIKKFILDKPYWVVMKRKNSKNPYFLLGVNNTELMEKSAESNY